MAKRRRKSVQQFQLDIVIPVYGQADYLQQCLQSIEETIGDVKAKVILVDDQGPEQDKLEKVYQSLNGTSRLIRNQDNYGYPKTANNGVKAGRSPLILLLNSDIQLLAGSIQAMMAEFENEQVGIVGPKLLFPEKSSDPTRPAGKVQHAGMVIDLNGKVKHANIGWSADHRRVNERREMQAVTGACLMTRRSVWREVLDLYRQAGDMTSGAMNEVYSPGTYEDIEYCLAAKSIGYTTIYQPQAVAYHQVGASIIGAGKAYPIGRNEYIFRARCGNVIAWDEWRVM